MCEMANPKKTYFLTPSFDYPPPPTGSIRLGNILADPTSPDRPLNRKASLVPPPPESLTTALKTDWKSTLSKSNSASIGLYAKFLELVVGAGVEASVNWDHGKENEYRFEKLETTYFNPLDVQGYLESALKAPNVKRYIERSKIRKPVYIITGLKIVRGGQIKSSKTRGHGGNLGVGVDGTALAAPVEVGPEFEVQRAKGEVVEWGGSDDFVFAYRLSRIKVKRKTREMKEEEYVKGALYELKLDEDGNTIQEESPNFEFEKLEGDEAIAGEFGKELVHVQDDDEGDCVCVVPEKVE